MKHVYNDPLTFRVVTEQLKGKEYDPEQAPAWCKTITEAVKEKVKSLGMDRYKVSHINLA